MARETLSDALKLMFGDEGGYSDRKTDSGGPTKYGVTHRTLAAHRGVSSVSAFEVQKLTLAEASDIYRQGYWTQSGGDILPKGLDYAAFDFGVNSGPARSVKTLQRVLGAVEDGNAGPQTLAAVKAYPGGLRKLIIDFCAARMAFLRGLKGKTGFSANGRGWTIRVTGKDPNGEWRDKPGVIGHALSLASGAGVPKGVAEPLPAGGDAKAEPAKPNPWTQPEVVLPGAGSILVGTAPFATGPILYAVAFGIVVLVSLGAFYAFRRIKRLPA